MRPRMFQNREGPLRLGRYMRINMERSGRLRQYSAFSLIKLSDVIAAANKKGESISVLVDAEYVHISW